MHPTPPRPRTNDGLSVLAGILYRPVPPDNGLTLAAAVYTSLIAGKPLGLDYRRMGIVSGGQDLAEITLCPAVLKEAQLLPDGAAVFPVLDSLQRLLGTVPTTLPHNNRQIPAVIIPAVIVRALISTDGSLPPAGTQAVAA